MMTELKKTLESNMKIRFHDCDPFNHLNNSRYLDYIMTARSDQLLDNYGLDIYQLAQQKNIGWVTAMTQVSYIVPALLNEEITIQTRLIAFAEKSLVFEALMWNSDKNILKAFMWSKLVHFDLRTQRSLTHSDELMQFFAQVLNPVGAEAGFETRLKAIKQTG